MRQLFKTVALAFTFTVLLYSGALSVAAISSALASEDLELALEDARRTVEVLFAVKLTGQEGAWYREVLLKEWTKIAKPFGAKSIGCETLGLKSNHKT